MESRIPLGNEAAIEVADFVKNALPMRPDRLIAGECRGPEAWDLLQAMNTGHAGEHATEVSRGLMNGACYSGRSPCSVPFRPTHC